MKKIGLYSGRVVDPTHLRSSDVDIDEVAYHLSRINRYNGGTTGEPYNVAEHLLLCCEVAEQYDPDDIMFHMACLMHDGPEYVLGDMVAPIKESFRNYRELESTVALSMAAALGYNSTYRHDDVRHIDLGLRRIEMENITNMHETLWKDLPVLDYPVTIQCMGWSEARERFVEKYHQLKAMIDEADDRHQRRKAT